MSKSFGQYIRDARKHQNLTQRELADKLGIHFTYISKIENDKCEVLPSDELLMELGFYLDIQPAYIFEHAGKLNIEGLKRLAQRNPLAAKILRRIGDGLITDNQFLEICEILKIEAQDEN